MMAYNRPNIRTTYRFYGKYPPTIKKEEYIKKKLEAFKDIDQEPKESNVMLQRNQLIRYISEIYSKTQEEIANIIGMCGKPIDRSQISRILGERSAKT